MKNNIEISIKNISALLMKLPADKVLCFHN